jgi:diguanylate cyclase (GGDEF)-like protein
LEIVEQLRVAIGNEVLLPEQRDDPRVTVSAGVATWPNDGRSPEELLEQADRRLFEAKESGRNRVIGARLVVESAAS